ncbi:MAG TPA: PliI family lysozyme inhibitor of I-type lysozyme [Candidatus Binatia bacterium]|jgi:hypothetical protein
MSRSFERTIFVILICSLPGIVYSAQPRVNSRFAQKFQIPGSAEVIVVAEGDLEPRSIGSYALAVYGGKSKKFPTDDFITGVIRPRNGRVEDVKFEDVDNDGKRDIIVIIRSAGSGGYISADAFHYEKRELELIGSVSDLDKNTDPVQGLRDKLRLLSKNRTAD